MREDWTECCFEDLLDYEQPTKYIVKSTNYNDSYEMPVLTAGKTFIKGYTNETDGIFENLPTIIFDDFTTATQYVNFKFKVKSSAMKILVPTSKLVNMPLTYYAMQVNRVRSDTHKRYWISVFAKKKFLLPPLAEQKAIVKRIEELFSSLDSGIADLKKAQNQLFIYRQAVLKKAFEGELTKEWREKNSINRKDWETNKLGEVLKTIDGDRGKNYPKKNEFLKDGYCLFLSTKNVRQGKFIFEENVFITEDKDNLLRGGKLERNDVILTTRGTLGNVALYDSKINFNNIRINSGMLILRVNDSNELSQHFLMRFINSSLFFQQLKAKQSGTAQPQIPANVLHEIEIEIPSKIEEQKQIILETENRLSVCDKVEESIKESLQKAVALRQSILKKAFEGKLLSEEEIAKCKANKDYEPASVLLERIKREKV